MFYSRTHRGSCEDHTAVLLISVQVRDSSPSREYPSLQLYVATEPMERVVTLTRPLAGLFKAGHKRAGKLKCRSCKVRLYSLGEVDRLPLHTGGRSLHLPLF